MSEKRISRKDFVTRLSLGIAAISAAAAAVPVISALVAPLLERKEGEWRSVGTLADFPAGSTKLVSFANDDSKAYAGVTAKTAAWLRRKEGASNAREKASSSQDGAGNEFIAFAANCTHLGCPVRWEEDAQLFMCPCHGGVYYKDGTVAAGPPPKPLTEYRVRVYQGQVQVQAAPLPITNLTASK
ncbi:MAG TPA: Rieske 2Fe-2S domain-containing protein [Puia sp.]|jgi:menaquinol-cytochrome c reductase iron-sulfur subunit